MTAELIVEVERTFGITISDDAAEVTTTVGELYDLIRALRPAPSPSGCLTSAVFYRLRQALAVTCTPDDSRIRPSTELEKVADRRKLRAVWPNLTARLGLRLPMPPPDPWRFGLYAVAVACFPLTMLVALVATWPAAPIGDLKIVVFLLAALLFWTAVGWFVVALLLPRRPEYSTVGDFTKEIIALNAPALVKGRDAPDDYQLWNNLHSIIVSQFEVPPELVTKDTSFVNDLGAD